MRMTRAMLSGAIISVMALFGLSEARADQAWSYSYSGSGVSGSGYIITPNNLSSGSYAINGLSGSQNSSPIISLLAPGTYSASGGGFLTSDNRLYPASPFLDVDGFTFNDGDLNNIYYEGGQYYDLAGADCSASACGSASDLGIPISLTIASVPSLQWAFSYSGPGVTGSGDLITLASPSGGAYRIIGLEGSQNGLAMNSLLPGGTYSASGGGFLTSDNLLYPTSPFLDVNGFTFNDGDLNNIYYEGGQYYDLAGADCSASACGSASDLGIPISFSVRSPANVPEPSSLPMLLAGLAAIGGALCLARKKTTAKA